MFYGERPNGLRRGACLELEDRGSSAVFAIERNRPFPLNSKTPVSVVTRFRRDQEWYAIPVSVELPATIGSRITGGGGLFEVSRKLLVITRERI